ncbi:MAG: phosphoribosylanthranilate isomerase [Flavobacteriaceae bacterium]|nr:phosphoribosylanthranilate isomerase [Flavobacteriaceae bacterium]MDH3796239.1 phosphoribosylanthranilate isomerase [Flavobacteriaceae bacterium]
MKIKVCGMGENYSEVVALQPDLLGFIFWKPSARYFDLEKLETFKIPKVGVFVDQPLEEILLRTSQYDLEYVQLHGQETPEFCKTLSTILEQSGYNTQIIKAFAISDDFDFSSLNAYQMFVSSFLFDAKGELPGGNGIGFNWEVLKKYDGTTPFLISGGIGLDDVDKIKEFLTEAIAQYCSVIDVNSKFELRPGVKNVHALEAFIKQIRRLTKE